MRRIGLAVVLSFGFALTAFTAEGQQQAEKMYRIGWLASGSGSASVDVDLSRALRETLRQLGYTEGRNLLIEQRFAEGRSDSLQNSAAQLVGLKVDALLTLGTPATLAAMQATKSIPIVIISVGDPVGSGLVSSLGKPGGNVTGLSAAFPDIAAKWVELLKDVVPGISRIGFLGNAANPGNLKGTFPSVQAAARVLGMAVDYFSATKPEEVGRALAAVNKARVQGLIVSGDSVIRSQRREIVEFADRARLPAVYFGADYVDVGGLMSYGAGRRDLGRQAATYVDKILKGAKPADLPVQQPTKFELVINMKTAKALGLTIPQTLLLRADQIIE